MIKLLRRLVGQDEFEQKMWEIIELNVGYQNKILELIAKQTGVKFPRRKALNLAQKQAKDLGRAMDELMQMNFTPTKTNQLNKSKGE